MTKELEHHDPLPDQFIERAVEAWAKRSLPVDVLADAMLAHSVNLLAAKEGRAEAVRVLRELAESIERKPDAH